MLLLITKLKFRNMMSLKKNEKRKEIYKKNRNEMGMKAINVESPNII